MKPRAAGSRSTWRIFAIPALLALLTGVGLASALTGDGWRDWISWLSLAAPVVAVAAALRLRRR